MTKLMKALIFVFLASFGFASILSAQANPDTPKFTIAISATKPEVVLGSDIDIGITISNISQQTLSLGFGHSGNVASGYQYDVRDGQGAPAAKVDAVRYVVTPSGKRLRLPSHPPGDHLQGSLKPGESIEQATTVSDIYKFDQPGKYTIQVSREVPWSPVIYSNIITVTVLPASSTPAYSQTSQQPFTINISADKQTVGAGSDAYIRIKLTNTSDQVVDCTSWYTNAMDRRYLYDVRDGKGKSVEIPGDHPELGGGSIQFCEVAPRDSTNTGSRLSTLYDFTKPGQYTVQVSRYIGKSAKEGVVKSNIITITVVGPQAPTPEPQ